MTKQEAQDFINSLDADTLSGISHEHFEYMKKIYENLRTKHKSKQPIQISTITACPDSGVIEFDCRAENTNQDHMRIIENETNNNAILFSFQKAGRDSDKIRSILMNHDIDDHIRNASEYIIVFNKNLAYSIGKSLQHEYISYTEISKLSQ